MKQLTTLIAIAVLMLLAPSVGAHHYAPIQPGALLGDPCTLNFVFEDSAGTLYIGAAAHCVPDVGGRAIAPGLGEFGTVVFSEDMNVTRIANGDQVFEFALIKIDRDKYDHVDPAHRYWGGPTGIAGDVDTGTATLHYAQGLYWQVSEASRSRVGVFEYTETDGPFKDWWHGSYPLMGGDSGSGVLTADGEALGMVQLVAITAAPYDVQPAAVSGPTFAFVLDRLADAGFNVTLVTAPFDPPLSGAAIQSRASTFLAHCQARPASTIDDPNGCLRPKYFEYHQVGLDDPTTNWTGSGYWLAMANPSPDVCPVGSWAPTLYVRACDQSVLIVDVPDDYSGVLEITLEWSDAADDLDLLIRDSEDKVLAVSNSVSGTSEHLVVQEVKAAHYLVQVNAVAAQDVEFALRANLTGQRTSDELAHAAHEPSAPGGSSSALSAVVVALAALLACIAARRGDGRL